MLYDIWLVIEVDLRCVLKLDIEIIDCIENVFVKLVGGDVVMLFILLMVMLDVNVEVDVKIVYIFGFDGFVIKVSFGFFNNLVIGLLSLNGFMVLLLVKIGQVQVVFLDNGYFMDIWMVVVGVVVV